MFETIAVVDDEQDILDLVSLHLKRNHFSVLDLMLPDADGFEICKHMKRKKNLSHIPIVMRSKIGSASKFIRNVHGVGYRLEE